MNRPTTLLAFFAALCLATIANPAFAVSLGQVDDFQDGTAQGWSHGAGSPNPPINLADAGPLGVGDHSLQISARGGGGSGSKLVAFNSAQWSGDYLAAGIQAIDMDLNNPNSFALDIRLSIDGAGGRFSTNSVFTLPGGSGWVPVVYPITPANLTSIGGADASATLAGLGTLRILHNINPSWQGVSVDGELLVDNIRAVPEPATAGILIVLLAGLAASRFARVSRR